MMLFPRQSELDQLARHIYQSGVNSGQDQAALVATNFAGTFGYSREDLLHRAREIARDERHQPVDNARIARW
ncbi:MAG: hypothetical protein KF889_25570 [Alphaproteobacteria bacterium]|nr:hypothetical protein [Alphaproteobacteria bacterium]